MAIPAAFLTVAVEVRPTLDPARVEAISAARANLLSHAGGAYEDLLSEIGHSELIYLSGRSLPTSPKEASGALATASNCAVERAWKLGDVWKHIEGDRAGPIRTCCARLLPTGSPHDNQSLALTRSILGAYREQGGKLVRATVRRFARGPEGVCAVETDQGHHRCDLAVVAAGAWSRDLAKQFGDRIPLAAERGYHIVVEDPPVKPAVPIVSGDRNVSMTMMEGNLRMTTMAEFAAIDAPPDTSARCACSELRRD